MHFSAFYPLQIKFLQQKNELFDSMLYLTKDFVYKPLKTKSEQKFVRFFWNKLNRIN
jgi:hypothetical protein